MEKRQYLQQCGLENWTTTCKIRTLHNTINKNTVRLEQRHKYKAIYYKILRGTHRQNTLKSKSQHDLSWTTSQSDENKNKWDLIKL